MLLRTKRGKGIHLQHWWEHKLAQPLWQSAWGEKPTGSMTQLYHSTVSTRRIPLQHTAKILTQFLANCGSMAKHKVIIVN